MRENDYNKNIFTHLAKKEHIIYFLDNMVIIYYIF